MREISFSGKMNEEKINLLIEREREIRIRIRN